MYDLLKNQEAKAQGYISTASISTKQQASASPVHLPIMLNTFKQDFCLCLVS